jgi:hypothetical protein
MTDQTKTTLTADELSVAGALEKIRAGDDEVELYFDPRTAQLVARRAGETIADELRPATELAQEGFFATAGAR